MKTSLSVCVYCGSRVGDNPIFSAEATKLGAELAAANYQLVFGAGSVGLMGDVSRSVLKHGGRAVGVIPYHLDSVEITQAGLTETIRVETMHERKKIMFDRSDAFVVLPGGLGSMDEMFEVLTWCQLGLHDRPIMVLNTDHYWSPLQDFIKHMQRRGFVDEKTANKLHFLPNIENVMARLATTESAGYDKATSCLF